MQITIIELDGFWSFMGEAQQFHIPNVPTDEIPVVALKACGLEVNTDTCRVMVREGRDLLISAWSRPVNPRNRPHVRVFAAKTGRDGAQMLDWFHRANAFPDPRRGKQTSFAA